MNLDCPMSFSDRLLVFFTLPCFGLICWLLCCLFLVHLVGTVVEGECIGVTELRSKLQYKVLKAGDGEYHPTVDSQCSVHYHGSLIDGEVFDSSVDRGRPTEFAPNRVIKGWTEALQLMVEGDKWELYIPSELAYGERGSGAKIKPGATLIFTVELLKILGKKVPADKCDPFTKEKCSEKELSYIATKVRPSSLTECY